MESSVIAYFDPGSGSMLVQLLVGGSAGLIVFARYVWERLPVWMGKGGRTKRASVQRA